MIIMPVRASTHEAHRSPVAAWQAAIPEDILPAGRYHPLRVLDEMKDFTLFEAVDTEAAGLRVEVRVYHWGARGENGPCWQRWRLDSRAMKIMGDSSVTALSTPCAGITVTRRLPQQPRANARPLTLREPLSIALAELLAALIVLAAFHFVVLEPGSGSVREGAIREACRGNRRHLAAALTMYCSEHGKYPETVSQLVPEYLPKTVACPAGGKYTHEPSDPLDWSCTVCGRQSAPPEPSGSSAVTGDTTGRPSLLQWLYINSPLRLILGCPPSAAAPTPDQPSPLLHAR